MINTTISTQPYLIMGDVFEKMKQNKQNDVRYAMYFDTLFNQMLDMFEWKNLPGSIPKRFLESILHTRGDVFVAEINGELIACSGTLSGQVDAYGLGTNCNAVCPTGEAQGKRNIDIAYGVNNDTATPDILLYWISHMLGETDKSIETNLVYSRFLKIPKVSNDKDKTMFEEIFKKLKNGEPQAFCSKSALDLEFGAGTECFELTDVNKIDKLPYLTQFFEDALKRFYNFYGQPMQNQNKRAQSISDEIHGQDSVSFILPLQMLRCRKALADDINRIFGTDISVEFSQVWELEHKALISRDLNENGIPDAAEPETEPDETEPEPDGTEPEPDRTEPEPDDNEPETLKADPEPVVEDLDPDDPSKNALDNTRFNMEEIAEALDVSVEELRQMVIESRG